MTLKTLHYCYLQVEMMRQGGNGQIREFYQKLQIENSPITILYSTKGANHYRDRLKERSDKVWLSLWAAIEVWLIRADWWMWSLYEDEQAI